MNLDESQKKKVAEWIGQGLKLSEIQTRLASELGLKLTYMDVRLLVDDLKLTPKDPAPVQPPNSGGVIAGPGASKPAAPAAGKASPKPAEPGRPGNVSVTVDEITRAGAVVSGKVTFSDGNRADWYVDQTGRLGLAPESPGYRPSQGDVQQFQSALDAQLSRLGL